MKPTPLNNTQTVHFENYKIENTTNYSEKSSYKSKLKDPYGIVPNGPYKVFALEKRIILIQVLFYFIISLLSAIAITLIATNSLKKIKLIEEDYKWSWFIIPAIVLIFSLYKFSVRWIEHSSIKKSLNNYREELKRNAQSVPASIANLYKKLVKQQIHHNWMTIFCVFYVGLAALFFWYFQDKNFNDVILNFEAFINKITPSPTYLSIVLTIIVVLSIVILIVLSIARKKRLSDIQEYFGFQVIKDTEVDQLKIRMNRIYMRLFFLSIAILLVIPAIILLILKRTIFGKRK
ncbi:MSC_0882 family membrane protein [Mesomycoplasma lagogenitalium]|uniref:Uncharacterized protein n=1 Tax=Mesomycoplasma lagogenitalium TaxID=171286 RepID=A0ABY8LWZ5_9BACT|nr:hypothetical protein [Mesomycoplasma lagogenitalium]WGI36642.1 hypothetical protein QEG99_04225 [Mesomycoplasma lagogenitalium]